MKFLLAIACLAILGSVVTVSADDTGDFPGHFLRSIKSHEFKNYSLNAASRWMDESSITHYRLVPGIFPKGMEFHFDGLATVMQFRFDNGQFSYQTKGYESEAFDHYDKCVFFGSGTGPTLGVEPCAKNPGVNLLPIDGQLWLTIDTALWGRVDPHTLETINAKVEVRSTVLNAHPACDPFSKECFVQYPCSAVESPYTKQACIGKLVSSAARSAEEGAYMFGENKDDMRVVEVSRSTMSENKIIQHSHSPCVTENYVVSKLDSFGFRYEPKNSGLLGKVHQVEDNLWMVMDRRTNTSRLLQSGDMSFVNNHFWNCYERNTGDPSTDGIVVDTVTATEDYLDTYFKHNLNQPTNWTKVFHKPQRCVIPFVGSSSKNKGEKGDEDSLKRIQCSDLLKGPDANTIFDYPTFNPDFKMNPDYRYTYAIAPQSLDSKWFDRIVKIDSKSRVIIKEWSAEATFVTEADFIPRRRRNQQSPVSLEEEDDGVLLSITYNANTDTSAVIILDARNFELLDTYPLEHVVPFHAHGISCVAGNCFTNP